MAIKGAFTAGLISGFASSFEKGIEERKQRMQELIDQQMDTAKRAAPKYAETKAQMSQIAEIGDAFKRDFNISDEEFLALTQTADVTNLYTSVYKEHLNRQQNGLGGVSGDEILKMVKLPEGFAMPKGETRDSMLEKMFGLRTAALKGEADPKSEGAQNRSFVKSLKDFMVIDPSMTAEQRLANMKVMGMDVNTLRDFAVSGGGKRDVIPGVTRESEFGLTPVDYKDTDAKSTQSNFYRMMTIRTTGTDFSNQLDFSSYASANPDNAKAVQKRALDASIGMAELERQIIRIGMGNPAVSGRAGRFDILNTIAQSVDTIDELDSLRNSITNGNAITIIQDAISNNRMLTEDDVTAIIMNAQKSSAAGEPSTTDSLESATPDATPTAEPEKPKGEAEMTFAEMQAALKAAATSEGGQEEAPTVETPAAQAPDTTMDTAEEVAAANIEAVNAFQEAAKNYTYEQYKSMTRKEKQDAGLPTKGIDAAAAFGVVNPKSFFKGGADKLAPEGFDADISDIDTVSKVVSDVFNAMVDEFPDLTALGDTEIKEYLKQNNVPYNDNLVTMIKMAIQKYSE